MKENLNEADPHTKAGPVGKACSLPTKQATMGFRIMHKFPFSPDGWKQEESDGEPLATKVIH